MKTFITSVLVSLAFIAQSQPFTGKVVNVIDGNTLEITDEYEEVTKFILKEVDCPEIGQPKSEEARAFSADLILKKKVTVEVVGKDMWGNKLIILTLKNGNLLHEALINNGLAWASLKASEEISGMQQQAQQNKLGIWSDEAPTAPWIYRRQQTMSQAKSR